MTTMNKEVNAHVKFYIRNKGQSEGYPLVLVMQDGGILCHECARKEVKLIFADTRQGWSTSWTASRVSLHWEGPAMTCDHCGTEIESAYGDPDSEE